LQNTDLNVVSGTTDSEEKFRYVSELYEAKKAELLNKDERIRMLEEELTSMSSLAASQIPFSDISAEARANYPNLIGLDYAYTLQTDFQKTDTVPIIEARWKEDVPPQEREAELKRFSDWIQVRLKNPKIQVREAAGE
jgi:thioester reductase-like protein